MARSWPDPALVALASTREVPAASRPEQLERSDADVQTATLQRLQTLHTACSLERVPEDSAEEGRVSPATRPAPDGQQPPSTPASRSYRNSIEMHTPRNTTPNGSTRTVDMLDMNFQTPSSQPTSILRQFSTISIGQPSPGTARTEKLKAHRGSFLRNKFASAARAAVAVGKQKSKFERRESAFYTAKSDNADDDDADIDDLDAFNYRGCKVSYRRYFQLVALLILLAILAFTFIFPEFGDSIFVVTPLWHWIVLGIVVVSGRLLTLWVVRILVFVLERQFLLAERVIYFVYALQSSVRNLVWSILVLVAWLLLFNRNDSNVLKTITNILICVVVAAGALFIKVLVVKVMASRFHVKNYFNRIQSALFQQYVLETLSGPPLLPFRPPHISKNQLGGQVAIQVDADSDQSNSSIPVPPKLLNSLSSDTITMRGMKDLMKFVRGSQLTTYRTLLRDADDEQEANQAYDTNGVQITSVLLAKAAAKRIFANIATSDRKCIAKEDLQRFLPKEHINRAWDLFEKDVHGHVTRGALKMWVLTVYQERRALARTLKDHKTIIEQLHRVLNFVVFIILIFAWLFILGVDTTKALVAASGWVLVLATTVGASLKTTFESIVWLFSVHPFDVGDRLRVNGIDVVVDEMGLMHTSLEAGDGERVFYPNALLWSQPISNYNRSPHQWDEILLQVDASITDAQLDVFRTRIKEYLLKNPTWWYPNFKVMAKDIENSKRLTLGIYQQHKMNFQQMGDRFERRAAALMTYKKFLQELGITYTLPVQPVQLHGGAQAPLTGPTGPSSKSD
eukprot:jgi/Chlat1/4712/Chrsp30S04761